MRSLLTAFLRFFLPPTGTHRAEAPALTRPSMPAHRPAPSRPCPHVVLVDGLPLVRPYIALWERERDELEGRRLQRERRRAAVLATMGQDYVPLEAAA
jgi:hypothetical protein